MKNIKNIQIITKTIINLKKTKVNQILFNQCNQYRNYSVSNIIKHNINNKYSENSIDIINNLKDKFNITHFSEALSILNSNSNINDSDLIKEFENLLIKNKNRIDEKLKAKAISFLSNKVILGIIDYNDSIWNNLFDDFIHEKYLPFESYFLIINSFVALSDHLIEKFEVSVTETFEFYNKFQGFLVRDNARLFNSIVEIKNVDDIFLFSKLINSKFLNFQQVSDYVINNINHIIFSNQSNITIKTTLIIPCLIVMYQDIHGYVKSSILFKSTISIVNEKILLLYKNYDILDKSDRETIDNLSDNLLFYAYSYINHDELEMIISKLIHSYTKRLNSISINWINEIRLLIIISTKLNYKDKNFWSNVYIKLNNFILTDFETSIRRLFKNQIKAKQGMNSNNLNSNDLNINLNNIQITAMFYIGVMIELASFIDMHYIEWEFLIESLKKNINFKVKDILYNLQFIYFHCNSLYSKSIYSQVWNDIIPIFNPKIKRIITDKKVLLFILSSLYEAKKVDPIELDEILHILFIKNSQEDKSIRPDTMKVKETKEDSTKTSNIELFCIIYELLDKIFRVSNSEMNNKIMGNVFVDLVKYENFVFSGLKIKGLVDKMIISEYDLFKEAIYDKVKRLISEDSYDVSLLKAIIILNKSNILNRIDLNKLLLHSNSIHNIEKEEINMIKGKSSVGNLLKSLLNK